MSSASIEAGKACFPISRMCWVLDIRLSRFFAWRDRPACQRQTQDMVHLARILAVFALSNSTYGNPRMHRDLIAEGHQIGCHRIPRLMRENRLVARQKRSFSSLREAQPKSFKKLAPQAPGKIIPSFVTFLAGTQKAAVRASRSIWGFGLFASMQRRPMTVRFRQADKPERQTA